jgi:hypothetical protein
MDHSELNRGVPILIKTLIPYYISRVKQLPIDLDLSNDTLISGLMCVGFLLGLCCCLNKDQRKKIKMYRIINKIINYVLLYIMIDHYLDSNSVNKKDKKIFGKWLIRCANNLSNGIKSMTIPRNCRNRLFYKEIWRLCLCTFKRDYNLLTKLTEIVVKTAQRQNKDLTKEELIKAYKDKGGWTVYVGGVITYGFVFDQDTMLKLGGYIQLIDDIMDCSQDIDDGIKTAVTYELKDMGNLDYIAKDMIYDINDIPDQFMIYKQSLYTILLYLINRSKHFSPGFKLKYPLNDVPLDKCFRIIVEDKLRVLIKQT